MGKLSMDLVVECYVGWEDELDEAYLPVGTMYEILKASEAINRNARGDGGSSTEFKELYEHLRSKSGEKIMSVGEVLGIQCKTVNSNGITSTFRVDDTDGLYGAARVDSEKYGDVNRELLREAKDYATKILRLSPKSGKEQ